MWSRKLLCLFLLGLAVNIASARPGVKGGYGYNQPNYYDYASEKGIDDYASEKGIDSVEYYSDDWYDNIDYDEPNLDIDINSPSYAVYTTTPIVYEEVWTPGKEVKIHDSSEEDGFDFLGWMRNVHNNVEDKWDAFSDKAEDVVDDIGDSFTDFGYKVHDTAKQAGAVIVDAAVDTKHSIKDAWESTQESVPHIWDNMKKTLLGYGYEAKKGAEYLKEKCEQVLDKAKGSKIFLKLDEKLQKGDAKISALFTLIGEKLYKWSDEQHDSDVDEGLYVHSNEDQNQQYSNPGFPDILQEDDVHDHFRQLVNSGILEEEDLQILYQTTSSHGKQNEDLLKSWDAIDQQHYQTIEVLRRR